MSIMTDIYQDVKNCGCPEKYFTKVHPGQRSSETKDITHDGITYPIYWNNCQKCAILGKTGKSVRFIVVSYLSQNTDLSLEGGRDDG